MLRNVRSLDHVWSSSPVVAALRLCVCFLLAASTVVCAKADDEKAFPSRFIRIIVPASPGGVNDILARLIAPQMSERLGRAVVVENKPGAATIVGAEMVARSEPDGYTLLMAPTSTIAINPAIYSKLSYAPQKDLIPLSAIASYPYVLASNPKTPVNSVASLVEFAKANPDKANAGGASVTFQLLVELFKAKTGAPIQYIPYKGAGDATLALMGDQLTLSFLDIAPAAPKIKTGVIKALAVTSAKRLETLPDVPTMAEAGLKDMTVDSWAGLFVPAGTPAAIVRKLQDTIMKIVKTTDFREKLKAQDLTPVGNSSKEFADMIARDTLLWSEVARNANVKVN